MNTLELRYGANPHQGHARLCLPELDSPVQVLNGVPSYINILDALTAWPLVRELASGTGKVAAASFKHLSPAGAAVEGPVSEAFVFVAHAGGSMRDQSVRAAAAELGVTVIETGVRCFLH